MLIGLGGYSPFEIKHPRNPEEEERQRRERYKLSSAKETPIHSHGRIDDQERPEGDSGFVWEALKLIAHLQLSLQTIRAAYDELVKIAEKATDLKRNDRDRILIDKKFQGAIRNYNFVVSDQEVQGRKFFAGAANHDPVELPLDAKKSKSINIEIKDLRFTAFNLGKVRIDTIVKARGVIKKMFVIEKAIGRIREKLVNKENLLIASLIREGIKPPDFAKIVLEEIESQSDPEAIKKNLENQSGASGLDESIQLECFQPEFVQLKLEQKARADKQGRQRALLVNCKA